MQPPSPPPLPRTGTSMSAAEAFEGTWQRSGGVLKPEHKEKIWRLLQEGYGSDQRHYHNLEHIVECLGFVGMCIQAGRKLEDPLAVEWAIWFHDVIIDPTAKDNEERCAVLAESVLTAAGLPPASAARAAAFIRATATHLHGPECDEHVVVDADMSVLGAPPPRYARYAAGVRREYGHLSDEKFAAGRTRFIRGVMEREQLFITDVGKSLEQQARANLAHELQLTSVGLLLEGPMDDDLPSVKEDPEEEEEEAREERDAELAAHSKIAARA